MPVSHTRTRSRSRQGASSTAAEPSPRRVHILSEDILAETIDQAVLHLLSAVRRQDVEGVTRTALFLNQSLVEAAERQRAAAEYARQLYSNDAADPSTWLPTQRVPSPSISQWIAVLDALASAALPAALTFMQAFHNSQLLHSSGTSASGGGKDLAETVVRSTRQCLGVLVNFCFFVVVTLRRTEDAMAAWALQSSTAAVSPELYAFLGEGAATEEVYERKTMPQHLRRLAETRATLVDSFSQHMSLLMFCADQQLWAITEEASVRVSGYPILHDLPRSAFYLANEDGWVWLLLVVVLYVLGPVPAHMGGPQLSSTASQALSRPGGGAPLDGSLHLLPEHSVEASSALHSSSPSARTKREAHAPSLSRTTEANPKTSSSQTVSGGPTSPSRGAHPTLSRPSQENARMPLAVTAMLRGLTAEDAPDAMKVGGSAGDYGAKYLVILTNVFRLFVKLWLEQQPTVRQAVDLWRARATRFPSADDIAATTPAVAALQTATSAPSADAGTALTGEVDRRTSTEDVTAVITVLTDIVDCVPQLFVSTTNSFLSLLYLLSALAPIQLYHVVRGRQAQSMKEMTADGEGGKRRAAPLVFNSTAVSNLMSVSVLMLRVADRVIKLALSTHHRSSAPVLLPLSPEACTLLLQLGLVHIHAETFLSAKTFPSNGASGYATSSVSTTAASPPALSPPALPPSALLGKVPNDPAFRWHWGSWALWVQLAFRVSMMGKVRLDAESTASTHAQFPLWCAAFAQCFCAAQEDVFAFTMTMTALSGELGLHTRLPRRGPVDYCGGLAVRRVKLLLHALHDPTSNITLGLSRDALPFAQMTEEALNAIMHVLTRYDEALRLGDAPGHRQFWLLAVSHLRLSSVEASCTSALPNGSSSDRAGDEEAREGMSNYICAGSHESVAYLRNRSYETYDEWLRNGETARRRRSKTPVAHAADGGAGGRPHSREPPLQRFSLASGADAAQLLKTEARDLCDVTQERLLMASVRFLGVAVRLAAAELAAFADAGPPRAATPTPPSTLFSLGAQGGHTRSDSPPLPFTGPISTAAAVDARAGHTASAPPPCGALAAESQAKVYVDAFGRFLLMLPSLTTTRLMSCLRTLQEELRAGEAASRAAVGSRHPAVKSALTDVDLFEAELFDMDITFSVT